jgi:hypothetical protein
MSHIAEVYAKDLGVKIGKPKLTEHFFPITKDKYICYEISSNLQAQKYDYWDIVSSLVTPTLNEYGISILEIPKIHNKQKNYFIKNSLLYFGLSNHYVNLADSYEVPSVSLLPNLYENNFNSFNHALILTPDFSELKPSFSDQEIPKRINEIKPEKIAQAIFDKLDINKKISFKTIKAGENFQNELIELVPNFSGLAKELQGKPINIRGDLHFDIDNIISWTKFSLVNLYLSQELSLDQINAMTNLKQIIFKHKKVHQNIDLNNFFKILKNKKINVIISCEEDNLISDVRLKYFDYTVIEDKKNYAEVKASKFLSKKKFIFDKEVYPSESSSKRLDKSNNFLYDDISSKELESLYLYDEE